MHKPIFDPRTPFDRAQARAAGITVSRLLGPAFRKLFHDCYVSRAVALTIDLLAKAAIGISDPGTRASHHTAARMWGGCVPDDPDVHVTVPEDSRRTRRDGIRAHLSDPDAGTAVRRGLLVSDPAQTFLELATTLSLVDLVVLGDSLVGAGVATPEEFVEAAARWSGRGARRARRAAAFVREGVDSPMESRLRMLIVLSGLPEPVINHQIIHEDGRVRFRLDLSYPAWRVAIEYEGRHHAESTTQWQHDITRREALDSLRWRLIIARVADIYSRPETLLARIEQALVDQGVVGVRTRGDTWRRHFPGRSAA